MACERGWTGTGRAVVNERPTPLKGCLGSCWQERASAGDARGAADAHRVTPHTQRPMQLAIQCPQLPIQCAQLAIQCAQLAIQCAQLPIQCKYAAPHSVSAAPHSEETHSLDDYCRCLLGIRVLLTDIPRSRSMANSRRRRMQTARRIHYFPSLLKRRVGRHARTGQ
eukprot:gene13469-biopygen2286